MMECDLAIQGTIVEALRLQASGSWRSLQQLSEQATGGWPPLAHILLRTLCANPLQEPEKDRANLLALADAAPHSACAIALNRSLLALAQQQLLTGQQASAEISLRQALACAANAVTAAGIAMHPYIPDKLISEAGQLASTIGAQLKLALARQLHQLPAQLVLVLGMHRSGTSALCGMLVKSGLDGPMDPMPATPNNPMGYFESWGAMLLNDQLLVDLGSEWSSSRKISEDCWMHHSHATESWRSGILNLLHNEFPPGGVAVLKDPRLCLLLHGLRPWLHSTLIPCTAFLTIRQPDEVVESLWLALAVPRSQGLMLWLRHVLEAERNSRGLNRSIIRHQDLMKQPESILQHCYETIEQAGGLERVTPEAKISAAAFIDPKLYHQHTSSTLPGWVLEEEVESLYALAVRVYTIMSDTILNEKERQSRIDQSWVQWASI